MVVNTMLPGWCQDWPRRSTNTLAYVVTLRVTGFVPTDATLSDPANDPPLLTKTRDRYDVDGDGLVSAFDVLMVINRLNRMQRIGQGESTGAVDQASPIVTAISTGDALLDDDLLQLMADDVSRFTIGSK